MFIRSVLCRWSSGNYRVTTIYRLDKFYFRHMRACWQIAETCQHQRWCGHGSLTDPSQQLANRAVTPNCGEVPAWSPRLHHIGYDHKNMKEQGVYNPRQTTGVPPAPSPKADQRNEPIARMVTTLRCIFTLHNPRTYITCWPEYIPSPSNQQALLRPVTTCGSYRLALFSIKQANL